MPPTKKRKVGAASSSSTPSKRVRVSGATDIPEASPTGRPKRSSIGEPQYNFTRKRKASPIDPPLNTPISTATQPKKRGRPAATKTATKQTTASAAPTRPRGRPPSVKQQIAAAVAQAPSAKRGRKPKALNTVATPEAAHGEIKVVQDNGVVDQDVQYWLMKAEPESRIEKGRDVKFSIDDLASKTEPEGWDGVRNAGARNNMRAMRKGDLAFFYHSNCAVPGIAGVMRIVEEHIVDESAFDPDHPYYDPKSDREKPKWELVKVEFVKKFEELITLRQLKSLSLPGSALQQMVMLKQSRLSVSPVTADEWQFILNLAGERASLGHAAPQDGYETDIDSESHNETSVTGDEVNGTTDTNSLNIALDSKGAAEEGDDEDVEEPAVANTAATEVTMDIDAV